jgi:CRP/FNR family transcriptional regulator, cyclic AMP receptor protein
MMTTTTDELLQALRQQPLIREFTPAQVDRLAEFAELVEFAPDDVIHQEGDECDLLYLVVSGNVAIELAGRHEVMRVETVEPGEEFGWSAMLQGTGRYFQARALGPVQALAFDATALRRMCDEDPGFGYILMRRLLAVVAGRLQSTRLQVADQHWTPAKRAGA